MIKTSISSVDMSCITNILGKYLDEKRHNAFIFGSVARKSMGRSSDIDIGIEGEALSPQTYFAIKNELEESDLPYTVDIVQFSRVDDRFKKIAKKDIIPLPVSQ